LASARIYGPTTEYLGQLKFVCQGHVIKVKVTATKKRDVRT